MNHSLRLHSVFSHYSRIMTNKNSNLVATQIVDRNGRLTTVHKKVATETTRSLPPVQINMDSKEKGSSNGNTELTAPYIDTYATGDDRLKKVISFIHHADPEISSLMQHLSNTGSVEARDNAEKMFQSILYAVLNGQQRKPKTRTWKEHCKIEYLPHLKQYVVTAWHAAEIIKETGTEISLSYLEDRMTEYFLNAQTNDMVSPTIDWDYWRGVSIMGATNLYGTVQHAPKFIPWAAKHANPKEIIRIAQERRSIDPDLLSAIIDQETPALNAGVL